MQLHEPPTTNHFARSAKTTTDERQTKRRWHDYAQSRSQKLREELIREYAPLARRVVDRMHITPWGCINRDDLIGYALIGLVDTIDRFDPNQGASFEAFAIPRIRGAVIDALRQLDWAPRSLRSEETRLRRAFERLEGMLGRPPTMIEVAGDLKITEAELDALIGNVARSSLLSLDDLVTGMNGPVSGEDFLADERNDPYQDQERSEAKERLTEAISVLPDREKQIVSLYYFHELTLREIGKILGITEQRVSQIHARAMLRMSHKLLRHRDLMLALAA